MSDSLLLTSLELIGNTTNPEYHLAKPSGEAWSLGEPVPVTAVIAGDLLDGDVVTGSRSANRTVRLPIRVTGSSRLDLATKVNALIQVVDAQPPNDTFTLTWTPNAGLPVVFDCYRGVWTRSRILLEEATFACLVTLTFQALPFGRSDAAETITTGSTLQVDGFNNGTGLTSATYQTTTKYEGSGAAAVTLTRAATGAGTYYYQQASTPPVSRAIASTDLTPYASISFRFRWTAPTALTPWTVHLTLRLGDAPPSDVGSTVIITVPGGSTQWQVVSFPLSAFAGTDLSTVTYWAFGLITDPATGYPGVPPTTSTCYIDDLHAYPAASTSALGTSNTTILTVPAVKGTARAPANLQITRGGSSITGLLLHRPPLDQNPDAGIVNALAGSPPSATVAAVNNVLNGTYTVILLRSAIGTGSRVVTVQLDHKQSGVTIGAVTLTATVTSTTGNYVAIGEVTLPIIAVPPENSSDTLVITVTSTGGTTDTYVEAALADTRGQTLTVSVVPAGTTVIYYDEPPANADIGQVYSSATDRTAAIGLRSAVRDSGGPVLYEPGDNRLLVSTPDGLPTAVSSYFPRWLDDRTV